MKKSARFAALAALLIAFLAPASLRAQEWTKDQLEVWKEVKTMFENFKNMDLEAAFSGVHEKYLGWNNGNPMPMTKKKWMDNNLPYKDMMSDMTYDIEPARIVIVGDAAVVHYYYSFGYNFKEGEKAKWISSEGKWTEFFVREKGKWMLLGDFTHRMNDDDD